MPAVDDDRAVAGRDGDAACGKRRRARAGAGLGPWAWTEPADIVLQSEVS